MQFSGRKLVQYVKVLDLISNTELAGRRKGRKEERGRKERGGGKSKWEGENVAHRK